MLTRLTLVALLVPIGLLWLAPALRAGSRTTSDGHLVRWDAGLEAIGERTARQVPVVSRQVAASLGFDWAGEPAEVVIVSGLERMRAAARVRVPDWAGGVCVGARSLIVIRADLVENAGPLNSMVTTLRHEWVHLAWHRRAGGNVRRLPLWVEEGIAEQIGGGVTVDGGRKLDFAARFGWLLPFKEIARAWPAEADRAALAYRQGKSWVAFFRDKSGWDHLQRILGDLADGKGVHDSLAAGTPFQELVFEHSGSTLSHWEAAWRQHVKEEADPWFHLLWRDLTGTLLLLLAVISAVAFFFIRRSRRRQIQALPDHPMPPGAEEFAPEA